MPETNRRRAAVLLVALTVAAIPAAAAGPERGGGTVPSPTDRTSEATLARLAAEAEANATRLSLAPSALAGAPTFAWPIVANGIGYFDLHGISGFVDHDPDIGELTDYECGERTYDTPDDYHHRGVDIFPWPYSWRVMDLDQVLVVAAAPGTIVAKDDGNFDRRCSCLTDDPNFVIVQHADGSRAWYLHLRSGSVTAKGLGETVAAGEPLGTIGSSGCSSGVHLHFEVHDSGADPGPLLDPYDGACNSLNASSLWAAQRPYREPTINRLSTHSAAVVFPACPTQETPNEMRLFQPGDDIYLYVFLHDETTAHPKDVVIRRPDGSVFYDEEHTADATYDASFWFWSWTGANGITGGPAGRWTWEATIDGTERRRAFWVGAIHADDFEDVDLSTWSSVVP